MISLEYSTGKIERDSSFITKGTVCKLLSPIHSYVGGEGCSHCGHNKGTYATREGSCVLCNHPKAEDSPETLWMRVQYMDDFRTEAMAAYYD